MKKFKITTLVAAFITIISFSLAGCSNQTFDDITYVISEIPSLTAVQNFNTAKTGMFNKMVEYETTEIKETLSGTEKTVTISKFGRISGSSFTQQKVITYVGDNQSYVTTTHYNGVIYTDTNGVVTSVDSGTSADISAFISSFIPSINDATPNNVTLVEEKQFEDVHYIRLTVDPSFINDQNPLEGNYIISEFKYEFGIHAQNNYLMMYRQTEIIVTDIPSSTPGGNYWRELQHTTTTIFKNSGENVQIVIPVVW